MKGMFCLTDLPHSNEGYTQRQDTDFRRSTDTAVYKQLGSNANYLKDQRDSLNSQAAILFSTTAQAHVGAAGFTTDGSGNYQAPIFTTPNNKSILAVFAVAAIASYQPPWPLSSLNSTATEIGMVSGSGSSTTDSGNFPLFKLQLNTPVGGASNSQVTATVVNGNTTPSGKSSPTWSGGTSGTIEYVVIYQS